MKSNQMKSNKINDKMSKMSKRKKNMKLRKGATYPPRTLRTARLAACRSMALLDRILDVAPTAPLPTPALIPYKGAAATFLGGMPGMRLRFSEEPILRRG